MSKGSRASRFGPDENDRDWCHVYNAGDTVLNVVADFAAHYGLEPGIPWNPKGSSIEQMLGEIGNVTTALMVAIQRADQLVHFVTSHPVACDKSEWSDKQVETLPSGKSALYSAGAILMREVRRWADHYKLGENETWVPVADTPEYFVDEIKLLLTSIQAAVLEASTMINLAIENGEISGDE